VEGIAGVVTDLVGNTPMVFLNRVVPQNGAQVAGGPAPVGCHSCGVSLGNNADVAARALMLPVAACQ
jgi:hypothetical protein